MVGWVVEVVVGWVVVVAWVVVEVVGTGLVLVDGWVVLVAGRGVDAAIVSEALGVVERVVDGGTEDCGAGDVPVVDTSTICCCGSRIICFRLFNLEAIYFMYEHECKVNETLRHPSKYKIFNKKYTILSGNC